MSIAAEVWQWSGGEPLELRIWAEGDAAVTTIRLGGEVVAGEEPQAVVPSGVWQAARPLGAWTLVGCIVAPAFSFDGFELAPDGWEPPIPMTDDRLSTRRLNRATLDRQGLLERDTGDVPTAIGRLAGRRRHSTPTSPTSRSGRASRT